MSDPQSTDDEDASKNLRGIGRRLVLASLAGAGLTGTVSGSPPGNGNGNGSGSETGTGGTQGTASQIKKRAVNEFHTRRDCSREQLIVEANTTAHASNDRLSETAVVSKFGKSLAHDSTTGLPTTDAYNELVAATETGGEAVAYDDITQAFAGDREKTPRPLVQPETAWTYLPSGRSTATLRIATPPAFDDPEAGAEMVELYWRALTRDVPFREYDESDLVAGAASELDSLDAYNGPGAAGTVTPANVFRGVTPGATTGPYVSQFLWKDRPLGGGVEDQKIQVQAAGSDFATSADEWLAIQQGLVPRANQLGEERYIITGRDMCERVHDDPPFRQIQKAAQVLIFGMDVPLDDGIPYTLKPFDGGDTGRGGFKQQTTAPFNDFGPLYIEKRALDATEIGQKMAWHKKWNVHRRLRPEEYGGRVEALREGSELTEPADVAYQELIPTNLLESQALEKTHEEFGTHLLPQAYAEGSPTHPSYPAGHSVVAGAGVTVLKAFFEGGYVFPSEEKVVPTPDGQELLTAVETTAMGVDAELTVTGELNKLASNMALGRNRAGIHYRSDGIEGLRLGEAAAIRYLEDQLTLPRRVPGYDSLTLSVETFDGDTVVIEPTI